MGYLAGDALGDTALMALKQYLERWVEGRQAALARLKTEIENLGMEREELAHWLGQADLHEFDPFA
jgi:hypothetical protein